MIIGNVNLACSMTDMQHKQIILMLTVQICLDEVCRLHEQCCGFKLDLQTHCKKQTHSKKQAE